MHVARKHLVIALTVFVAITWVASVQAAPEPPKIPGIVSPDGSRVLFVTMADGDAEIHVARPDGSDRRKLTDNDNIDVRPEWSPDGKHILFVSDRSSNFQVHVMDARGMGVRQLTREELGVGLARYGPDGRIAYTALRDRYFKQRFYDLVLLDGPKSSTIAKRRDVSDFAWRPDGKAIAYGGIGWMIFHDLVSNARTTVLFDDIDKRLESHVIDTIRWQPDRKSITCRIVFAGGRTAALGSEPAKMFGDDEQFVITVGGKLSWSPRRKSQSPRP